MNEEVDQEELLDIDDEGPEDGDSSEESSESTGIKYPNRKRPLTDVEWAEIRAYWELGTKSLGDLAKMYNRSAPTIWSRLKREKIKKGIRAVEAGNIVRSKVLGRADIDAKRAVETKEQHYAYAEALAKLAMKIIVDAKADNRKLSSVEGDLKSLERASNIVARARDERWKILGLDKIIDKDSDLPDLVVTEMTPKDIQKAREQFDDKELDDVVTLDEGEIATGEDEDEIEDN